MDTAATRIRQARLQRGWNQDELAARLGTSRKTVIQWEKHGNGPGEGYARKLSELFAGDWADYLGAVRPTSPGPGLEQALLRLEEHLDAKIAALEGVAAETRGEISALREAFEALQHQTRPNQGAG